MKKETIQIWPFLLKSRLKGKQGLLGSSFENRGGSEFVEPFTLSRLHSVCVLIGIPFWKPVRGSDPSRQPLQEDAGLVLMLSNRGQSGAF